MNLMQTLEFQFKQEQEHFRTKIALPSREGSKTAYQNSIQIETAYKRHAFIFQSKC